MAAIGRFQKRGEVFHAKVVDGKLFARAAIFSARLHSKGSRLRREGVKTLVPVAPSKIICVGLNYADHARETGKELPKEPLIWFKATTSLLPDGGKIEIPFPQHRTDFEAELCIVIGRKVRNVSPRRRRRATFSATPRRRTSATGRSSRPNRQWARAKSFDTFTPLGPFVETKIDPDESDHSTLPERPVAPKLEHEPAYFQAG